MRIALSLALLLAAASLLHAQTSSSSVDDVFRAFWEADSVAAAGRVAERIGDRARFDDVAARLRAGRPYARQKVGRIELPTRVAGIALDNVLEVPADYDPSRPIPLRVSLHGGVGRPAPAPGEQVRPLTNRIPGGREIVLHPRAFADVEWWKPAQVDNILRLVDRVKRAYNVDESHVYLTGISDGGTGVYYLAMRDASPWSACVPLNGQPLVIANPATGAEGELYATNLQNCTLHAVNGGRDRLYPAASVKPLIDMLHAGGIPVVWQVFPEADHDTSWWPEEKNRFTAFVAAARASHPRTISWTTERIDRFNRFRWLVIDRLGQRTKDADLKDVNTFEVQPGRRAQLFERHRPAGRVDAVRDGNRFEIKTRGVAAFTLLLSDDVIDFAQSVRVTVNGVVVHDAKVIRTTGTLLKWAARDNDRTMLYAAELPIIVP